MFTFVLNPGVSLAKDSQTLVFSEEGLEALDKSVYVNLETRTVHLDKEKALHYYRFTDEELNQIQQTLDNLTEEEIEQIIIHSTANSDGGAEPRVASIIVWVSIAILAIFTSIALYFSSKYMTHKEKQTLINRCYDIGGRPVIDSGDTGGLGGAPEKAWWKISNTYTFECVQ